MLTMLLLSFGVILVHLHGLDLAVGVQDVAYAKVTCAGCLGLHGLGFGGGGGHGGWWLCSCIIHQD